MLRKFFNKVLKLCLIISALLFTIFLVYMAYRFVAGQYNHYVFNRRIQGSVERGGTKYYISLKGNDANDGTSPTNAWKTIEKVNQIDFKPADEILLKGGETFRGNLRFDSNDIGTPANPITINSYGENRAVIETVERDGIFIYNSMGFQISNLNIVGSGQETNNGSGISVINDLTGDVKLDTIRINSVEAQGFSEYGIAFGGNNGKSGFRNLSIENTDVHDNALAGIYIYGTYDTFSRFLSSYAHEQVVVRNVKAYDNSGTPGANRQHSGSGIVLSDVDDGIVERSAAYNNGWLCDSRHGGPVGIWAWDSNNIIIQHNESYGNKTGGKHDGGGFDFDGGMKNSVLQYNYSHDNDGAGFLVMQFSWAREYTNNTVRYNISQNDGRKNSYGAIQIWGDVRNSYIYNNTVYVEPAEGSSPRGIVFRLNDEPVLFENQFATNLRVANNIFITGGEIPVVEVARSEKTLSFQNNNYYSSSLNPQIIWADNIYRNLSDWRADTGQERNGEKELGFAVDPLFQTTSDETIFGSSRPPEKLEPFCLKAESPLIDAGLDITNALQINAGKQDFFGTTIPQNKFDLGACEFTQDSQKNIARR